jgi:prevent-host-death family protein
MLWQVQEAKQRFSELLRAAASEGPQIVTRHGHEIAVVIDVSEFHRMRGDTTDFKDYLRSGPELDDLDLARSPELPRDLDWSDER